MEQCLMKSTATNKTKKVRVIPGYHLTLGITVTMLSLIVLIPLASVMVSALKLRPAEFWSLITKPPVRHAFATSIGCSFIAALINSVFGVIIAWVLVRYEFPGKRILDGCIELPFALPTSVAGITLSKMYSENGILGTPLAKLGIKVSYTHLGLVIALVFVGIPFVIRRIKQFAMCPFDAIATSASVFCSQNMGARQPERIKKGLRQGVAIATIYGLLIGLVLIFGGRTLSMIFVKKSAADVLDASGKYLRCLGYFFWSLGILNVSRMVTQGLGYSGRAVLSGVTEMLARTIVSLGFVGALGYTAICFADQAAWIAACCYIAPTCLHCVKKVTGILEGNGNR